MCALFTNHRQLQKISGLAIAGSRGAGKFMQHPTVRILRLPKKPAAWKLSLPALQTLVLGQSLAGVATSVLSLVTTWASPVSQHELPDAQDVSKPATLYFLACGLVVLLGILGYWLLPHLRFVQHWTLKDGKALPPVSTDIIFGLHVEEYCIRSSTDKIFPALLTIQLAVCFHRHS